MTVGVIAIVVRVVTVTVRVVSVVETEAPATIIGPAAAAIVAPVPVVAIQVIVVHVDRAADAVVAIAVAGRGAVDPVAGDIVIESAGTGEGLDQIGDRSLGIVGLAIDRDAGIVPAILQHDIVEAPGLARDGRVDQPSAVGTSAKCGFAALIADFVAAAGVNQGVITGIERKEHPQAAVGIVVEYEEKPVNLRIDLEPDAVAFAKAAVVVHPD
jgi:hypothetical protein